MSLDNSLHHIKVTSVRMLRVRAEDCSTSNVARHELIVNYSLTADAVHALTDLISDITTLATISWSLKPATTKYPMGYGKIESLGALAVSCILLGGGIGIGLQAVLALSQQFFPQIHEVLSHLGFLDSNSGCFLPPFPPIPPSMRHTPSHLLNLL